MIRTADAAGFKGSLFQTSQQIYTVSRPYVPCKEVIFTCPSMDDSADFCRRGKEEQFAHSSNDLIQRTKDYRSFPLEKKPFALVMGNEGQGLVLSWLRVLISWFTLA